MTDEHALMYGHADFTACFVLIYALLVGREIMLSGIKARSAFRPGTGVSMGFAPSRSAIPLTLAWGWSLEPDRGHCRGPRLSSDSKILKVRYSAAWQTLLTDGVHVVHWSYLHIPCQTATVEQAAAMAGT